MTAARTASILSDLQTIRVQPGGFFCIIKPVFSELHIHMLIACADYMEHDCGVLNKSECEIFYMQLPHCQFL